MRDTENGFAFFKFGDGLENYWMWMGLDRVRGHLGV